ncbi:DUF3105 domain-containing protein [Frankia sp. CNm7]|uniref:DUF3105 domain-containing protein n=1 Tax=Frankia nepalensis TaxID=1836974 RepID=A0A937UTX1_9ACTN|nr:DUF3105 domain-containing protein [Frankia nepalensis]MBL7496860.1 DUF3105 domain-containing protein [Frankia nepalensis]MBL7519432.1 DUF3105 domain-containing protein [Frankia nepalensis]MBL7630481.1 DUF3105 domain-containing protein [Frankia nepalensis]
MSKGDADRTVRPTGKKKVDRNARLDALRREQKRKERRRAFLIYGTAGGLALVLLAVIVTYSVVSNRNAAKAHKVGYVAAPSAAAQAANCTGVVNDPQQVSDHLKVPGETFNYKQVPPSSGNHDGDPLPDQIRFYNPTSGIRVERAVHNLEHGFVVGWYDAKLPADQIEQLRKVAANAGNRFIAVPWTRSDFADNRHFVLTAWDRTQRCGTVSEQVVADFIEGYGDPGLGGVGWDSPTAPESGYQGGTFDVTEDGPLVLNGGDTAVPSASPTMGGNSP